MFPDPAAAQATTHPKQPALLAFWRNLKKGYDLFEGSHKLPRIKTSARGVCEFSVM